VHLLIKTQQLLQREREDYKIIIYDACQNHYGLANINDRLVERNLNEQKTEAMFWSGKFSWKYIHYIY